MLTRELEPTKIEFSAYFKTGLISILYAMGAIAILIALGVTGDLIFSTWFQTFIAFTAFAGTHLSGSTYFGRVADLWSNVKTRWSTEFKGTVLAITAAVLTGISLTVLRLAGHFFVGGAADIAVNIIGSIGCVIGTVGSIGGFGNRLSSGREPKAIFLGTLLGLGTSLGIWFTGHAGLMSVAGITSFMTGGLAIPVWIIGTLFVISFTGTNVSSFDYHARALHYFKYFKKRYIDGDEKAEEIIKGNFHQFRGAAVGILSGIVVATIAVVMLGVFITQPWLLAIPIAMGIYLACTSICGGICARTGRKMDELENVVNTPKPSETFREPAPPIFSGSAPVASPPVYVDCFLKTTTEAPFVLTPSPKPFLESSAHIYKSLINTDEINSPRSPLIPSHGKEVKSILPRSSSAQEWDTILSPQQRSPSSCSKAFFENDGPSSPIYQKDFGRESPSPICQPSG